MEQDIKILEDFIEYYKEHGFYGIIKSEKIKILEHLIKAYKEQNDIIKTANIVIKDLQQKLENSIPVSLVEEKIEEILNNNEYRIIFEGDTEFPDDATIIKAKKYIEMSVLEELLEKRK